MLKPNKLCKVCLAIKENPQIEKDLYATTYYVKSNKFTLADITRKYEGVFPYTSVKNHVKSHQFLTKTQKDKKALLNIKKRNIEISREKTEVQDVWDEVISQGMQDLKDGKMYLKPQDLLKAAKDKSDYQLKANDQKLAYAEMMWHFASGESNESENYDRRFIEGQEADYYDPTEGITEDSRGGEERPSNLHNSTSWDALTQRSDKVSEGSETES